MAVKLVGSRWVRGEITARLGEKASFGRKKGGGLLGSRENYGQISEKSKIWP
ncbi:MAG: hypothetical protein MRZ84_03250 [Eubacterium sp.]|nr:hypothetical protein [Eubacterium sp.]